MSLSKTYEPNEMPLGVYTYRVTVTYFRSISMPAGFRRHLMGKTLINVSYSDVT